MRTKLKRQFWYYNNKGVIYTTAAGWWEMKLYYTVFHYILIFTFASLLNSMRLMCGCVLLGNLFSSLESFMICFFFFLRQCFSLEKGRLICILGSQWEVGLLRLDDFLCMLAAILDVVALSLNSNHGGPLMIWGLQTIYIISLWLQNLFF